MDKGQLELCSSEAWMAALGAVAIDPLSFGDRLERAGFQDVKIDYRSFPRFSARAR